MQEAVIDAQVRNLLWQRCCQRRSRLSEFSPEAPTDWRPQTVRNPTRENEYFTEDSAWEYVAQCIEDGVSIEVISLRKPPGKSGYVLKLPGYPRGVEIYVKLQLGSSKVIGRSFHESYRSSEKAVERNAQSGRRQVKI